MRFFGFRRQQGFSLIELAIVLVILGLLLGAFLQFYGILDQKQRIETTRERLGTLRTALIYYVLVHNRLPCPASAVKSKDAGADKDACAPDASDPPEGVASYTVHLNERVERGQSLDIWSGVVPVRDLRLDPQMGIDGWGNRFTYAVSRNLTLPDGMHGNPMPTGHISVVDENGANLLETPGTGRYVIISHGPSGTGAWTTDGKRRPCAEGTRAALNCSDNGGIFVMAPFSTAPGENFFDNIVIDDDVNAGGTLLDRIAICTRRLMFFAPGTVDADKDGCIPSQEDNGLWHGICLKSGDPNAPQPVRPIMSPAVAQGNNCSCMEGAGLVPKLAGTWLEAPEIENFPPGAAMMSLYTCVRP